uniref:Putative secreted peptide n=1 Tax=Anopheles braziliensis TaxID=58242 RepID=A0A2M3ZVU3_9DIPT
MVSSSTSETDIVCPSGATWLVLLLCTIHNVPSAAAAIDQHTHTFATTHAIAYCDAHGAPLTYPSSHAHC